TLIAAPALPLVSRRPALARWEPAPAMALIAAPALPLVSRPVGDRALDLAQAVPVGRDDAALRAVALEEHAAARDGPVSEPARAMALIAGPALPLVSRHPRWPSE